MKIKRILSAALVVALLSVAVLGIIPVTAGAAYSESSQISKATLSIDEIKEYIDKEYLMSNYSTAEEMLAVDMANDRLDYVNSQDGFYTIYINRYTGFLYYKNNYTGQIITSNPVDPAYKGTKSTDEIMSQLTIELFESSNSTQSYTYDSVKWAARYGQISVSKIKSGLRVNYTLGDTSSRFLLPGMITAEDFTTDILRPMLDKLDALLHEHYESTYDEIKFEGSSYAKKAEKDGYLKASDVRKYINDVLKPGITDENDNLDPEVYDVIVNPLYQICYNYNLSVDSDGRAVYSYKMANDNAVKREHERYVKSFCPDYTLSKMLADEKECGYVHKQESKPVLRCAIEYTFNEDGTLSIRVPSNSISFDETVYTLKSITPLQYFGYGNMSDDGFIFYPDGSGTVVSFDDFYSENQKVSLSLRANVFGQDYCYSTITGAHREQITMPVYGLVNEVNANATTKNALKAAGLENVEKVDSGFFAIFEEGASLAELRFSSGGSMHKYGSVYASYTPYPSDTYDLSQTLSVGSLGTYTIVSESRYTGSYVTRIKMISDDVIGSYLNPTNYYPATYSGMATYYRDYLKADGTLTGIDLQDSENIPLYIEVLGSMTITEKFLTFPVEKSIALTSFDDIVTMYKDLAKASDTVKQWIKDAEKSKADYETEAVELREQAANAKDSRKKSELIAEAKVCEEKVKQCDSKLAEYDALLKKIGEGFKIMNINFRLTGFANGGMYYTYPTKIKWERAVGGNRGFKDLVSESKALEADKENYGAIFNIFPEFDFMYISNTEMFDGINNKGNVSKMVDNRYASKQVYNAVVQKYESFFTMVISSDVLDEHFEKFNKKYSKYDLDTISLSTLGSDVNSNFDKKNSINRDESRETIVALLDKITNKETGYGYSVMVDKGNIYSVKYADHILNISTDSSHFKYSSYAVPFIGMVLHGYVSYAGTPINYSGSTQYEILRSIENGAAPYYILCYQNVEHMKDDEQLNKYYGVNYNTWYDDILVTYSELNNVLGKLQAYEIVEHKTVIVERTQEESERQLNYTLLEQEYLALFRNAVEEKIAAEFKKLAGQYDVRVTLRFDKESIVDQFAYAVEANGLEYNKDTFEAKLNMLIEEYNKEYPGYSEGNGTSNSPVDIIGIETYVDKALVFVDDDGEMYYRVELTDENGNKYYQFNDEAGNEQDVTAEQLHLFYESRYNFYSDSNCYDEDYEFTEYTLDNDKVVLVKYQKGDEVVYFILNYNIYSVDFKFNGVEHQLGKYEYIALDKDGNKIQG